MHLVALLLVVVVPLAVAAGEVRPRAGTAPLGAPQGFAAAALRAALRTPGTRRSDLPCYRQAGTAGRRRAHLRTHSPVRPRTAA